MSAHLFPIALMLTAPPPVFAEAPSVIVEAQQSPEQTVPAVDQPGAPTGALPQASPAPAPVPGSTDTTPQATPPEVTNDANGEADVVVRHRRRSGADPLENVNETSYKAVQAIDGAVVAPLARGYKKGLPRPVRQGIHNFLDHVQEPIVFLNYLLQLKPGKAMETLGRFVINSTAGVAGLFDVAKKKPFHLPHRPNSLANTLGYYGVKPGPYFFLPLIGPTSLRDLVGTTTDRLLLPQVVGAPFNKPYYTITTQTLSALDYRVAFDDQLTKLHNADDPYLATRKAYFAKREAEIDQLHSPAWRARHPRANTPVAGSPLPSPEAGPVGGTPASAAVTQPLPAPAATSSAPVPAETAGATLLGTTQSPATAPTGAASKAQQPAPQP